MHEVEGSVHVDVDGQRPSLDRLLQGQARRRDGRVVDEDVAPSPFVVDTIRECLRRGLKDDEYDLDFTCKLRAGVSRTTATMMFTA